MTGSVTTRQRRKGIARATAMVFALLLMLTITLTLAPLAGAAATGSVIVVRRAGGKDALWSVPAAGGAATKLVDLAFRPQRMVGSPDDARIAILPNPGRAVVYVYDIAGVKLTPLSFASLGVRHIDAVTWLSATKLLVSGTKNAKVTAYATSDRLYTIAVTGGKPAAFKRLRGTEPSAAPAVGRILYVRLRDAGRSSVDPNAHTIVEKLMSLKLGGKPHALKTVRYVSTLDIRRFRDPAVSPDGKYVITSTTGSDVSVTYSIRRVATGRQVKAKKTTLAGRDQAAWTRGGGKVAFWGMPPSGNMEKTDLYIWDAASATMTGEGPFSKVAVTGLCWSPDDSLLAYATSALGKAVDIGHLWTIAPVASATPTDLGEGSLPVWVP